MSENQESIEDVLIVGLGAAGQTHVRVLEDRPGVRVVGGVDPSPGSSLSFRGEEGPVYSNLEEAGGNCLPTAVVVAVPTPQHVSVTEEVLDVFSGTDVFVEKPLADNWSGALRLLDRGESRAKHLQVLYHMAFSPEVLWAKTLTESHSTSWGGLEYVESWFSDAHAKDLQRASATLGSSWLDSGVNALGVLQRFADVRTMVEFRELDHEWQTYEAVLSCVAGGCEVPATIITSWGVTEGTRETRLRYREGPEVVLDHAAVAGRVLIGGRVRNWFGTDGRTPRREMHYRNLYESMWGGESSGQPVSAEVSKHLHRLLLFG